MRKTFFPFVPLLFGFFLFFLLLLLPILLFAAWDMHRWSDIKENLFSRPFYIRLVPFFREMEVRRRCHWDSIPLSTGDELFRFPELFAVANSKGEENGGKGKHISHKRKKGNHNRENVFFSLPLLFPFLPLLSSPRFDQWIDDHLFFLCFLFLPFFFFLFSSCFREINTLAQIPLPSSYSSSRHFLLSHPARLSLLPLFSSSIRGEVYKEFLFSVYFASSSSNRLFPSFHRSLFNVWRSPPPPPPPFFFFLVPVSRSQGKLPEKKWRRNRKMSLPLLSKLFVFHCPDRIFCRLRVIKKSNDDFYQVQKRPFLAFHCSKLVKCSVGNPIYINFATTHKCIEPYAIYIYASLLLCSKSTTPKKWRPILVKKSPFSFCDLLKIFKKKKEATAWQWENKCVACGISFARDG